MRILTQVAPDIEQLFDSLTDLKAVRSSKKILVDRLLFLGPHNFAEEFRSSIGKNLNPEVVSLIVDLVSQTPRAVWAKGYPVDVSVGLEYEPVKTLEDISDDDEIEEIFRRRTSTIQKGEKRLDAFNRSFLPLASVAKRVDIADRYAASSLTDRKGQRFWLFEKFLEQKDVTICISTGVQDNFAGANLSTSDRISVLEKSVEQILNKKSGFRGKIHIDIFEIDKYIFHNRRLRFQFENSEVSFLMEKGMDGFSSDLIQEQQVLASLQAGDFGTYLKTLRTQKLIQRLSFTN